MPVVKNKKIRPHAKMVMRVFGLLLSVIGLALTVSGAILVRDGSPLWYIMFVGIPIIIVGVFLFVFSFQREVVRYVISEQFNEFASLDNTGSRETTSVCNVKASITCTCGEVNSADSYFCKKCGKSLRRTCENCGAFVPCDGDYCTKCGAPLNGDKNNIK